MVVSGAILFGLSRSPVGLILQATGQDAIEAAALGFNVTKHKLAAFCVSALFSGLAGGMLIFYLGTASVGTVVDIGDRRANHHRRGAGRPAHHPRRRRRLDLSDRWPVNCCARSASFPPSWSRRIALVVILFFPRWLPGCRLLAGEERARMTAPLLEVSGLTKRFGGLVAVQGHRLHHRRPGKSSA